MAQMIGKINYRFSAQIWKHQSNGAWFFVSLSIEMSQEIRKNLKGFEEGWGRMKAFAQVGKSTWETAIWFDSKNKTYLLPLKSEIRKNEKLEVGNNIEVNIWV